MASARVHEVIAKEINKEYGMDETLLRIGTVSPDCWRNVVDNPGFKDKYLSHFWDFRIKEGQANNYEEFYIKYYNQLSNPFYFGYLIHLIADQYWKTYVDSIFRIQENGINGFRLKDGSFHDDENWFGYIEDIKIQKMLAREYNLGILPTEESDIPNFCCQIDELDLSGLFGESGTLSYINRELSSNDEVQKSLICDLDEIVVYINDTVSFIKQELERLKGLKEGIDKRYKVAVDIDDTLLSTKELEEYYFNIFLQENPQINPNKEYKWGDKEISKFWSEYREKMAFGKVMNGASEVLDKLMKKGCVVDLLSARPIDKYAPLKKKFVEYLESNNLYYDYMFFGKYSKVQFLKEHGYDLLIDNELRHIEEANMIGMDTILFGPVNLNYTGLQASSWSEVDEIIEKIFSKQNKL